MAPFRTLRGRLGLPYSEARVSRKDNPVEIAGPRLPTFITGPHLASTTTPRGTIKQEARAFVFLPFQNHQQSTEIKQAAVISKFRAQRLRHGFFENMPKGQKALPVGCNGCIVTVRAQGRVDKLDWMLYMPVREPVHHGRWRDLTCSLWIYTASDQ